MKKLIRIAPKSLAKVFAALYAMVGFIGGALFALISLIAVATGARAGWFGIAMLVLLPLFYGLLGALFGWLTAILYNFVAGKVGGVEVEVE